MKDDCSTCLKMCSNPVPSDWFSKHDVDYHYCRIQICWMIKMADLLDFGIWPEKKTGYIDTRENIQRSPSAIATHEATIGTWAEVYARLERCGEDGLTLWTEAKQIDDFRNFSRAAKNALNYCSGYKRRAMNYKAWLKQRKYRGKIAVKEG